MQELSESLPIVRLTDRVAAYMNQKVRGILTKENIHVPFPREWSLQLLIDCDLAATVIAEAFQNRISTSWAVDDYAAQLSARNTGRNTAVEAKLARKFPPIHKELREYDSPLMVTDVGGKAFTWYLPGALSTSRKDMMWKMLLELEPELKVNHKSTQWRVGPQHFRGSQDHLVQPGVVNMAPAWFEQGHDTKKWPLKVSKPLVASNGPASRWLSLMVESSALIGGILSVVHPELYEAGKKAMLHLDQHPNMADRPQRLKQLLQVWSAPFHGLSVISNRRTPVHRDSNGGKEWMDILVALGSYQDGALDLPGVGIRLHYAPGTVVAIAGRVIAHTANCDGDRACIAYYMRQKVQTRLGLSQPGWFVPSAI